jgi:cell division protein ZapA
MADVNVVINGRQFRMACEPGEEDHLMRLAQDLDARILDLRGKFGEIGDTKLTVMAALTVADQLSEAIVKMRRLEDDLAGLEEARAVAADRMQATHEAIGAAFNSAAERIERIAKKLNQAVNGSGVALG